MQTSDSPGKVYSVGIICALAREKAAVEAMLDEEHPPQPRTAGDNNIYTFGKIGEHSVVVACLPGDMGTTSASIVAVHMTRSFPIKIGLMVGICGGVWSHGHDVRLGDVVVSRPTGQHGGVVQWDFGKMEAGGGFHRKGSLNKPPRPLGNAVAALEARHLKAGNNLQKHLDEMLVKWPRMAKTYARQRDANDQLFDASYSHVAGNSTCAHCDPKHIQNRPKREDEQLEIHYGNIASGNAVIKDGPTRDRIASREEVLCFEMEAAGLMDEFPCVVIRGVCDYADSHKNKMWQDYAAAVAAAYAKELLLSMPAADVALIRSASEAIQPFKRVVHIPFSKNFQFVGRRTELEVPERRIFTSQDCQRLAVVGLGGMGKTQLALSFAYSVRERHPETSIFWIPALSAETYERAAEKIAQQLEIRSTANQSKDAKELVKQHLSTVAAGKWLLIVDNADDLDVLEASSHGDGLLQHLPESHLGVTIFTTRTSSIAQRLVGINKLTLDRPTKVEAFELLECAVSNKASLEDSTAVTDFLIELEYLPLAIMQAAAYMNINDITVSEYLGLLQNTTEDVIELMSEAIRDDTRYDDPRSAVATTWVVSFKQIVERHAAAASLLQYISCIEWKGIPRSILPPTRPEARMMSAIGTLCSYSFLSKQEDGVTYDMHRLVHLASRIWLEKDGRAAETQAQATMHLSKIFPTSDYQNRETWRAFLPHVTRMKNNWTSADVNLGRSVEERSKLCFRVGQCLQVDGRAAEALRWLEECTSLRRPLPENDPDQLAAQHVLAIVYRDNGRAKEAIQLLEHVVALQETSLAPDHPSRLASQHELAGAYRTDWQMEKAIQLLQHIVAVQEMTLAVDHSSRLASQHGLAIVYRATGRVKGAIQLLEHVVSIRSKSLKEDHIDRLASQHELGSAYLANGQTMEAIQLLQHIVTIEKTSLAEGHPRRLASQHELACAYAANRQLKEAIQLLQHIVTIEKSSLAEDHPDRLLSQHVLARMYAANGQLKEAIQLFEHVVTIRKMSLAECHPDRLASQHELGSAYEANGQTMQAIQLL